MSVREDGIGELGVSRTSPCTIPLHYSIHRVVGFLQPQLEYVLDLGWLVGGGSGSGASSTKEKNANIVRWVCQVGPNRSDVVEGQAPAVVQDCALLRAELSAKAAQRKPKPQIARRR